MEGAEVKQLLRNPHELGQVISLSCGVDRGLNSRSLLSMVLTRIFDFRVHSQQELPKGQLVEHQRGTWMPQLGVHAPEML